MSERGKLRGAVAVGGSQLVDPAAEAVAQTILSSGAATNLHAPSLHPQPQATKLLESLTNQSEAQVHQAVKDPGEVVLAQIVHEAPGFNTKGFWFGDLGLGI